MSHVIRITNCAFFLACLLALHLGVSGPLNAQEPMAVVQNMPGFKPNMAYQDFGKGETVNLGNGGLTIAHPSAISLPQNMGGVLQPVRVYNSKNPHKPWLGCPQTTPTFGCLGPGWSIGFGRVFARLNISKIWNNPNRYENHIEYYYRDESGAEHRLYLNMSYNPDQGIEVLSGASVVPKSGPWYLTNDGSYLRARFNSSTNQWTLYYPDGSKRVAGGVNAYEAPLPSCRTNDLGRPYGGVSNLETNGWYVTTITDRAENVITINYNLAVPGSSYQGSISSISDQFGRLISFTYYSAGTGPAGYLKQIYWAGMQEDYSYYLPDGASAQSLLRVSAPASGFASAQLDTMYQYTLATNPYDSNDTGFYLTEIRYPTGAVSTYQYTDYWYMVMRYPKNPNASDISTWYGLGVSEHSLYINVLDTSTDMITSPHGAITPVFSNVLRWSYKRKWNNAVGTHYLLPRSSGEPAKPCMPIRVSDPLGTQEVHFFRVQDHGDDTDIPVGKELLTVRLLPGVDYDPGTGQNPLTNVQNSIISRNEKFYTSLDAQNGEGDAKNCAREAREGSSTKSERVPGGNSRLWKTLESELASGIEKWFKKSWSLGWDGYGHHEISLVQATSVTETRINAAKYDVVTTESTYQLDRLRFQYTGGGSSATLVALAAPTGENPPNEPDPIMCDGFFKIEKREYGATNSWGLPTSSIQYAQTLSAFNVNQGNLEFNPEPPSEQSGDRRLAILYTNDSVNKNKGNISRIDYSNAAPGGNAYGVSYSWSRGMVTQMQWDGFSPDFVRTIDLATSRITSHREANNTLATTFEYYSDGRLKKIAPPGEAPEWIDYPTQQWSRNNTTWAVGHVITHLKANGTRPIDLKPGDSITLVGAGSNQYTYYQFDDLGRLWRTGSVNASSTAPWTEKTTGYDPLGRALFTSEPYAYGTTGGVTYQPLAYSGMANGGQFTLAVPYKANRAHVSWDSIHSAATANSPLAGTVERFYRTQRLIKPDLHFTAISYDGLVTYVDRQTATGTARTTEKKDALGRTVEVDAPADGDNPATNAAYTYDLLGNLFQVSLGSQQREFHYDGLGHATSALNPETGTITYNGYDALGNLLSYAHGGTTITKAYDLKGRLLSIANGSTVLSTWAYDTAAPGVSCTHCLNQLTATSTTREDGSGTVEEAFAYNHSSARLTEKRVTVSVNGGPPARTYKLTYDYNDQGQVSAEAGEYLGSGYGFASSSTFTHGPLTSKLFSNGLQGCSDITYYPSGAVQAITYTNGTVSNYMEDAQMARLRSISVSNILWKGRTSWSSGIYGYDGSGNITSIGSDTFKYDNSNRLTEATVHHDYDNGGSLSTGDVKLTYSYDPWGNIKKRHIEQSTPIAWMGSDEQSFRNETEFVASYQNANNHFLDFNQNGAILTTTYDTAGKGNLVQIGNKQLDYDVLNQTKSVAADGGTEDYYYDASGERVAVLRRSGGTVQSAAYYARSGPQVAIEEQFTYSGGALTKDLMKGYLYVGGNLAATQEGDLVSGPTYSISGTVSGATASGVTMTLSGAASATTTTDTSGNYTFSGLANGSYTVTPSKSGFTFSPTSTSVTISGANQTDKNFTATASTTYSISGTVSGATASGVTMTLSGAASATTTTDTSGNYTFSGLANGSYVVTPSKSGYTFSPTSISVTISGANQTGKNFTATAGTTYSISGTVSGATASGVTMTLSGAASATTTTDTSGNYTFSGLANGSYTVTPNKSGYTFSPTSISVTISGANQTGKNFTATAIGYSISGTITCGSYATVFLSGGASSSTTADYYGNYSFSGIQNGSYTVTPSLTGYTFDPPSRSVSINGANVTGQNFAAVTSTIVPLPLDGTTYIGGCAAYQHYSYYSVQVGSGAIELYVQVKSISSDVDLYTGNPSYNENHLPTISDYTGRSACSGTCQEQIWHQNPSQGTWYVGVYGAVGGTYQVTSRVTYGSGAYSISGTVRLGSPSNPGLPLSGVTIDSGSGIPSVITNLDGTYTIPNLVNSTYTVSPSKEGYSFSPASQSVLVSGANRTGIDFWATQATTCSISGYLKTLGGAAIKNVRVRAKLGTAQYYGQSGYDGGYTISGLIPTATYKIEPDPDQITDYTWFPIPPINIVAPQSLVNFTGRIIRTPGFTATDAHQDAIGRYSIALSWCAGASVIEGFYQVAYKLPSDFAWQYTDLAPLQVDENGYYIGLLEPPAGCEIYQIMVRMYDSTTGEFTEWSRVQEAKATVPAATLQSAIVFCYSSPTGQTADILQCEISSQESCVPTAFKIFSSKDGVQWNEETVLKPESGRFKMDFPGCDPSRVIQYKICQLFDDHEGQCVLATRTMSPLPYREPDLEYVTALSQADVRIGDLSGDVAYDLILQNSYFKANLDGTFTDSSGDLSTTAGNGDLVRIADLNGDKLPDRVLASHRTVWVEYNSPAGPFSLGPSIQLDRDVRDLVVGYAPLNMDGHPRIIAGTTSGIYLLSFDPANGWALEDSIPTDLDVKALALGDINNDGLNDIVAGGQQGVRVFWADPWFTQQWQEDVVVQGVDIPSVDVADANGDGFLDIAAARQTKDAPLVYLFTRDPLAEPLERPVIHTWTPGALPNGLDLANVRQVVFADLDAYGVPGLLCVTEQANQSTYLRNNRAGGLLPSGISLSGKVVSAAVGDFDGNGALDIAGVGVHTLDIYSGAFVEQPAAEASGVDLPPALPVLYDSQVEDSTLRLTWIGGEDDRTPRGSLTFEVVVGTAPGVADLYSGEFGPTYTSARLGNNLTTTQALAPFPESVEAVYWGIRAVDSCILRSPWLQGVTYRDGTTQILGDTCSHRSQAAPHRQDVEKLVPKYYYPSVVSYDETGGPALEYEAAYFSNENAELASNPEFAVSSSLESVPDSSTAARSPEGFASVTTLYYVWDHLGSTRLVIDQSRTVTTWYDFEPYGIGIRPLAASASGTSTNTHQFTGHERDLGTGFDYTHFRFYTSSMGRFMKPDNIPGNLMNPQSWNKYAYVNNNPVNFNDPTGHMGMIGLYNAMKIQSMKSRTNGIGASVSAQGTPKSVGAEDDTNKRSSGALSRFLSFVNQIHAAFTRAAGGLNIIPMQTVMLSNEKPPVDPQKALQAVDQAAALLNVADTLENIVVTKAGIEHVVERHTASGDKPSGKSLFFPDADLGKLLKSADSTPAVQQERGNFERIIDSGEPVGIDRATGEPTSTFTVITDKNNVLRTMFPGIP